MKRYTTAQARKQFAELLDAAERGQDVVIERRGVLFVLHAGPSRRSRPRRRVPLIEWVDPVIMEGQWTWRWDRKGLRFAPRGRRR